MSSTTPIKKVIMTDDHKLMLENMLVQKTAIISSFYKKNNAQSIILSFGDQLHDLALFLLCPALSKHNLPIQLIFMPDSHTDTMVYETLTKFSEFYINLKIIPIKFLQGLYKNLFSESLNLTVLENNHARKGHTSSETLNSIRQTIISTLVKEKNYLFLDATSKTHFLLGHSPLHLSVKHTLCPFGHVNLSNLYDWIKTAFPSSLHKDIEKLSNILSVLPGTIDMDDQQLIDKINELNKYATLNKIDYFPII